MLFTFSRASTQAESSSEEEEEEEEVAFGSTTGGRGFLAGMATLIGNADTGKASFVPATLLTACAVATEYMLGGEWYEGLAAMMWLLGPSGRVKGFLRGPFILKSLLKMIFFWISFPKGFCRKTKSLS